jgi:poly(A) polymerase
MKSRLDPAHEIWMQAEGLARVFAAIEGAGGTLRFVGGCVRDALLGRAVGDIDFACDLPPEKTSAALTSAGLKAAPTGVAHGTVTAVADHKGYEITSLRRDLETDGRRAKVEFTDDWKADAARRDFTINAIYADKDGALHDYFDGGNDLARGQVRFIGRAEDRIKEDVLRILRFFRFTAWFGKGAPDAGGLKACRDLALMLPQLSAERVWKEIAKLLAAENPAPVWRLMIENRITAQLLPEAVDIAELENLLFAEKRFAATAAPLTRLAALLPAEEETAVAVARALKMSNRESERLALLAVLPLRLAGKLDPQPFRRMLYDYGAEACIEAALLCAADDRSADIEAALAAASEWQKPVFPVQGADLLKLGIAPGPRLGEALHKTEEWWIARDFRPSREECLAFARDAARAA